MVADSEIQGMGVVALVLLPWHRFLSDPARRTVTISHSLYHRCSGSKQGCHPLYGSGIQPGRERIGPKSGDPCHYAEHRPWPCARKVSGGPSWWWWWLAGALFETSLLSPDRDLCANHFSRPASSWWLLSCPRLGLARCTLKLRPAHLLLVSRGPSVIK